MQAGKGKGGLIKKGNGTQLTIADRLLTGFNSDDVAHPGHRYAVAPNTREGVQTQRVLWNEAGVFNGDGLRRDARGDFLRKYAPLIRF